MEADGVKGLELATVPSFHPVRLRCRGVRPWSEGRQAIGAVRRPWKTKPAPFLRFWLREQLSGGAAVAVQPHPKEAEEAVNVHRISGHAVGRP
eukprot:12403648-Alexandrium_andersonii.AAC.1